MRVPSHHVISSPLPIKSLYHGHASLNRKWGCLSNEGGVSVTGGGVALTTPNLYSARHPQVLVTRTAAELLEKQFYWITA